MGVTDSEGLSEIDDVDEGEAPNDKEDVGDTDSEELDEEPGFALARKLGRGSGLSSDDATSNGAEGKTDDDKGTATTVEDEVVEGAGEVDGEGRGSSKWRTVESSNITSCVMMSLFRKAWASKPLFRASSKVSAISFPRPASIVIFASTITLPGLTDTTSTS